MSSWTCRDERRSFIVHPGAVRVANKHLCLSLVSSAEIPRQKWIEMKPAVTSNVSVSCTRLNIKVHRLGYMNVNFTVAQHMYSNIWSPFRCKWSRDFCTLYIIHNQILPCTVEESKLLSGDVSSQEEKQWVQLPVGEGLQSPPVALMGSWFQRHYM